MKKKISLLKGCTTQNVVQYNSPVLSTQTICKEKQRDTDKKTEKGWGEPTNKSTNCS